MQKFFDIIIFEKNSTYVLITQGDNGEDIKKRKKYKECDKRIKRFIEQCDRSDCNCER